MTLLEFISAKLGLGDTDPKHEKMAMKGSLTLELTHEDGSTEVRKKDNIIVNGGFDAICDSIGNSGTRPACMGYIELGTGSTAPASTQTTLTTALLRQAAAYAHTAGTQTFTFTATFAPGAATGAIQEAGVFNAASAGIMLDRVTFAVINKGASDTLTATFQFTLS